MDRLHILVVDDNHINRLFFQSSLKKINCKVSTAEDGFVAIEFCESISFDLILMDIRMNGMNGIETAEHIKKLKTNKHTPIVAISAEAFDTKNHVEFSDSLLKPVKQELLATTLLKHTQSMSCFDHEKALGISHNNEDIVNNLRVMFIDQLRQFKSDIIEMNSQNDTSKMADTLHKLLGSARICAAELMVEKIKDLKTDVDANQTINEAKFKGLISSFDLYLDLKK